MLRPYYFFLLSFSITLVSCGGNKDNGRNALGSFGNGENQTIDQAQQACLDSGFSGAECTNLINNANPGQICTTTGLTTTCTNTNNAASIANSSSNVSAEIPRPSPNTSKTISTVHNSRNVEILNHNIVTSSAGSLAMAYWTVTSESRSELMTNLYQFGDWQGQQSIGSVVAHNPHVSMNPQGDVVAVWEEREPNGQAGYSRTEIWAAVYRSGWQPAQRLSSAQAAPTDFSWYASQPKVSFSADGTAMAVWALTDHSKIAFTSIYRSTYDGSNWSVPEILSDGTTPVNSLSLQLAANSQGNAVVTWAQNKNLPNTSKSAGWDTPNVWATLYVNNAFTGAQRIGNPVLADFDSAYEMRAAINENNTGVVHWNERHGNGPQYEIKARTFSLASQDFNPDTTQIAVSNSATDLHERSYASLDSDGNILIVWRRQSPDTIGETNAWYRYYDTNKEEWLAAEMYEESDGKLDLVLPVNSFGQFDFIMAWEDWPKGDVFNPVIRLRSYTRGVGLSPNILSLDSGREPRLTTSAFGESFIVATRFGISSNFTTEVIAMKIDPGDIIRLTL